MANADPNPTNPATRTAPSRSSEKVAHKTPLGWLPWALLLGLLLLIGLILLLVNLLGDDDDTLGTAEVPQVSAPDVNAPDVDAPEVDASLPAAPSAPALPTDLPSAPAVVGPDADEASGPAADTPALSAGGTDLIETSDVGSLVGEAASGRATVQAVVSDEGFWVGPDATNRVYVHLTPESRNSEGESPFQVEAGQEVALTGNVVASSADVAQQYGVTEQEGRQQLVDAGGYIEAATLELFR